MVFYKQFLSNKLEDLLTKIQRQASVIDSAVKNN